MEEELQAEEGEATNDGVRARVVATMGRVSIGLRSSPAMTYQGREVKNMLMLVER